MACEGAGVREGIEDPTALGVGGHQIVILALVEVEAGLLAGAHDHGEAAFALGDDEIWWAGVATPPVLGLEAFDSRRRRVILPIDSSTWKQGCE